MATTRNDKLMYVFLVAAIVLGIICFTLGLGMAIGAKVAGRIETQHTPAATVAKGAEVAAKAKEVDALKAPVQRVCGFDTVMPYYKLELDYLPDAARIKEIRIVGATEKPASIPYRANMTLLDAMIAVGGLSEYASGNQAKLIRFDRTTGRQQEYSLRLGDLLRRGESEANVMLMPGDVIIIPESMF